MESETNKPITRFLYFRKRNFRNLIYSVREVNWTSELPNISKQEAQHAATQNFLELATSGNGNLQRRGLEVE